MFISSAQAENEKGNEERGDLPNMFASTLLRLLLSFWFCFFTSICNLYLSFGACIYPYVVRLLLNFSVFLQKNLEKVMIITES